MLHARPAVSIRARRLFPLRRCRPLPVVLERVGLLLALRRLQPLHPIVPILHIHSVQPICFCRPFIRLPTRYALRRDALLHYTRLFLSKKGKEFRGEQGQPDGAQRACWFSCPTPTAMEIPAFGSVCKTHCVQQNRVRWPSRPRRIPPSHNTFGLRSNYIRTLTQSLIIPRSAPPTQCPLSRLESKPLGMVTRLSCFYLWLRCSFLGIL